MYNTGLPAVGVVKYGCWQGFCTIGAFGGKPLGVIGGAGINAGGGRDTSCGSGSRCVLSSCAGSCLIFAL